MDINQVLARLPHRYPMLMIDRVKECEPGKRIVALKNVSAGEPYFQGHFPGRPIMPGVLVLSGTGLKPGSVYYYVGIDNARFKKPVVPGDQLEVEVAMERLLRGIGKFACVARVAGELVAEATILCTVRPPDPA